MNIRRLSLLILLMVCTVYSSLVFSHGNRHRHSRNFHSNFHWGVYGGGYRNRLGFYFGVPFSFYPYSYYNYPYYYPPTIITVPDTPPVYVQQPQPNITQEYPSGYWYYCFEPQGYYPQVKECPGGWQQVEPILPPSPSSPLQP